MHRLIRVGIAVALLTGVLWSGGSVAAASPTTLTWKISSLAKGKVAKLSTLVTTNSPGVKTWSISGSCTLTPSRKPTKLMMGAAGSCTLTLKIAKSGRYVAKTAKKTITVAPTLAMTVAPITTTATTVAPTTTTTVAPITTTATTVAPTTTTTVAPTTTTTVAPTTPTTTTTTTTTIPLTCATGGTCAVHDVGPGGGVVFYAVTTSFQCGIDLAATCKYLEVAPRRWYNGSDLQGSWGGVYDPTWQPGPIGSCSNKVILGARGTSIGSGFKNTAAILDACSAGSGEDSALAARAASDYAQSGKAAGWFLPSKDELNALCKWSFEDTINAVCNAASWGGLTPLNGSFSTGGYWSSSEFSANNAWGQDFGSNGGHQGSGLQKFVTLMVRPVRAF